MLLNDYSEKPGAEALQAERARRSIERAAKKSGKSVETECSSLLGFIRQAWPILFPNHPFVFGWHIELICKHLEAVTRGEFLARNLDNRLLINIPPSGMKSLLMCVFWPAWEWGPCGLQSMQYIATSFKEDNVFRDARRMRTLVESTWFQQHWPTELVITGEGHFENRAGGWRKAIPFQSLTGGKCDRLLIDDPHSVDTAESDTDRDKKVRTFRESITTRLNHPVRSFIGVVMQRLHEKDISGAIISLKLPYVHVMLPMRFEPERKCVTPFGEDPRTEEGALLWPEWLTKETVDRDEKTMGSHAVAGQHQQRPAPRGGLMFKRAWFEGRTVKQAPAHCRRVRGWDLAASVKATSPYTCGVKLSYDGVNKHFYVEHVLRERVENPESLIVSTAKIDTINVEVSVPQDPGAAGKIQARSLVGALAGFRAYYSVEGPSKEIRALSFAAQCEAGNVWIVEGEWNEAYLDELVKFPAGSFKDQVDATSRAFSRFVLSKMPGSIQPILVSEPYAYHGDNSHGG